MTTSGRVCSTIDPSIHLTKRQVDILARLHAGILPKQIATELSLSYETVVEHLGRAARTFGTHGRVPLINAAIEHGFIRVPPPPNLGAARSRRRLTPNRASFSAPSAS